MEINSKRFSINKVSRIRNEVNITHKGEQIRKSIYGTGR